MRLRMISPLLAVLAFSTSAPAATILIPQDYADVADGLNAASFGDTVLVDCGVYVVQRATLPSGVLLRSTSGDPSCVVLDGMQDRILELQFTDYGTGVEGLTFRNGSVTQSGGAIFCTSARIVVSDCVFEDNSAHTGGAIYLWARSNAAITRSRFESNDAAFFKGGGCIDLSSSTSQISDCSFVGNDLAISADDGSGLTVSDTLFEENTGGVVFVGDFTANFNRCTFLRNNVSAFTGSASTSPPATSPPSTVWAAAGSVVLDECVFIENTASSGGAASAYNGGRTGLDRGSLLLRDCLLVRNSATGSGGAVNAFYSDVELVGCTIYQGSAGFSGAALRGSNESSLIVESTIIAGTTGVAPISVDGTIEISCSNVYGNSEGDWVEAIAGLLGQDGNISADPLFCDPNVGDFSLMQNSPCAPGNHPEGASCELIGAFGIGCGVVSIAPQTWSRTKALYR